MAVSQALFRYRARWLWRLKQCLLEAQAACLEGVRCGIQSAQLCLKNSEASSHTEECVLVEGDRSDTGSCAFAKISTFLQFVQGRYSGLLASLLGARMLLGAPGRTTRGKEAIRNKFA